VYNGISIWGVSLKLRFKIVPLVLVTSGLVLSLSQFLPVKVNSNIEHLNLDGIDKLMIVAHPDDETLWGGAELLKDDYLVVCITCGEQKNRSVEFEKVMRISNNKYIMFGIPDKIFGNRSDWKKYRPKIIKNLNKIINHKDWNLIVTHNPDGEYGHEHHKMTNKMVEKLTKNKDILYYFGRYVRPSKIKAVSGNLTKIDKKHLDVKINKMIKIYKTQEFIETRFGHMFEFENWVKASEWEEHPSV